MPQSEPGMCLNEAEIQALVRTMEEQLNRLRNKGVRIWGHASEGEVCPICETSAPYVWELRTWSILRMAYVCICGCYSLPHISVESHELA